MVHISTMRESHQCLSLMLNSKRTKLIAKVGKSAPYRLYAVFVYQQINI